MNVFTAFFTAVAMFFSSFSLLFSGVSTYNYKIDTSSLGNEIPNIVDNINIWDMGTQFYDAENYEKYDIFKFVKYVQLMQCTGGTPERDLFKDPYDTSVLDDYDFTRLIKNCRGILNLGAKPHLKLGGVPIKYTSDYVMGGFDMNPYPPDNYNVYYNYIKAMAQALVDEFGIEEVKTWRFGCMTEYENKDWFYAKDETPKSSEIAYCKLYDYTVQALIDVIGNDVFVGAHCMGVTEGLWDERNFLKHCGTGINYATGEKGSRICFVSASFYDGCPGHFTSGFTVPELMKHLKKAADRYGLNNVIFGIDEGRILSGVTAGKDSDALTNRVTAYTWQAAYDARIFKQAIDSGMDYFSSWSFLSNGILSGFPTMSYHIANNIYKFGNGSQAKVTKTHMNAGIKIESDCLASWNENEQALRLMAYNFKNDLAYDKDMNVNFNINLPQLDGKTVTVTKYLVNDDCNFFDEFLKDRKIYNIGDECFSWSPDSATVDSNFSDPEAKNLYYGTLRNNYEECAVLTPVTETAVVENGRLMLNETLEAGNVVFYEICPK